MTDHPETLADLLAPDAEAFAEAIDTTEDMEATLRHDLGGLGPGLASVVTLGAVWAVLYRALDVRLDDILRGAWQTANDLQPYRDPDRYPPDQEALVEVGRRQLTSRHRPKVEVLVQGLRLTIEFEVTLTLTIIGGRLRIRDGRIREITGSVFEGECLLTYGGMALLRRKTNRFEIPGRLALGEGLPIAPIPEAV